MLHVPFLTALKWDQYYPTLQEFGGQWASVCLWATESSSWARKLSPDQLCALCTLTTRSTLLSTFLELFGRGSERLGLSVLPLSSHSLLSSVVGLGQASPTSLAAVGMAVPGRRWLCPSTLPEASNAHRKMAPLCSLPQIESPLVLLCALVLGLVYECDESRCFLHFMHLLALHLNPISTDHPAQLPPKPLCLLFPMSCSEVFRSALLRGNP